MSPIVSYAADAVPGFPAAVELHWEIANREVWNEHNHATEERELVYEISWMTELGAWRRFLRSQRKRGYYGGAGGQNRTGYARLFRAALYH
jgi:hypothetical protein